MQTRPKLKDNLRFTVQRFAGEPCCVLEDPRREQFWRVGVREWRLLNRFDGQTEVAHCLERLRRQTPDESFDDSLAQAVTVWAVNEGLVENLRAGDSPKPSPWLRAVNASVFYRLRLGNPQPILRLLYPIFGWLTHPILILPWLAVLLAAGLSLVGRWEEFGSATLNVISPDTWWYFLVIWWGLKLIHETAHGLTCLRYGGNVRAAGILFLLFAPLGAYVDVTSAWRFASKWQRMHVTFAGIYSELFVAALAAFLWCFSDDTLVRQLSLQTFLLASIATIAFNANPLIRFDGYYLLADLLEIPNLYQQGQLAIRRVIRRVFLGRTDSMRHAGSRRPVIVFAFGVASLIWRLFLTAAIALTAASLLNGAGLVLALLLVIAWWLYPLLTGLWNGVRAVVKRPQSIFRVATVAALLAACLFAVSRLHVPNFIAAPGVVQAKESSVVRAEASGFLEQLSVEPGGHVRRGDVLATLSNPDLDLEVLALEQEVRRNAIRVQALLVDGLIAESQAEQKVGDQLKSQLATRRAQQARLVLHAPHDGTVVDFETQEMQGRHFRRGDRLIEIVNTETLEFSFVFPQSETDRFEKSQRSRQDPRLFFAGTDPIACDETTLVMDPGASWELPSPALGADQGGRVPVMEVVSEAGFQSRTLHPYLSGRVAVHDDLGLKPGLVGTLRLEVSSQTIGSILQPKLERAWMELQSTLLN